MWGIALVKTREGDGVGETRERGWMGDWGEIGESLGRVGWETGESWEYYMSTIGWPHILFPMLD